MNASSAAIAVDRLVEPLGSCLTPESARRLLKVKADKTLQDRVDDLATRHAAGLLNEEERAEYSSYVAYSTFVAILKSQARRILAASGDRE